MKNCNILFTSAGRRVSLVKHFKETLHQNGIPGIIVTTDMAKHAPAGFVSDIHELVPRVSDPSYIQTLLSLCIRHDISVVIPLIDTELTLLAAHKDDFELLGVKLLVSSAETNEICFDKRNTHAFFVENGIDTPAILDPELILANPNAAYPYLLKPANGSSSVGVTKIRNSKELAFFKDYIPNPILQELIVGQEYTMDILVDFEGCVRTVVPRLRLETRAGEVSKGITVKNEELIHAGRKVAESLPGAVGCITAQCFVTTEQTIKFIEINPRFGGGFPLSIASGADFPLWIIRMLQGNDAEIAFEGWSDGVVMLRYDDAIFTTRDMIEW